MTRFAHFAVALSVAMALFVLVAVAAPAAAGMPGATIPDPADRIAAALGRRGSAATVQDPGDAADLARGRALYVAHCGRCHGMDGGGGEGPLLAVPELERVADLEALRALIRAGVPGTAMRGLRIVTDDDVRDIAAFVFSLGRTGASLTDLPGDPEEGAALYASMDCSSCHVIDGRGGTMGPVLTGIGRTRGIEHLREALLDPGATLPEYSDSSTAGSIYLLVTVQTRDGRRITGTRVNEDTFTIQIRDEEDVFHSILKSAIVALDKRFGESLMPSYADTLNEEGINALVAYLATLRGGS